MEIFHDDQQWLDLGLAEEEVADGLQCAVTAKWPLERVPSRIARGYVEERKQCRQRPEERGIQREELAGQLLADAPRVIPGLDAAIALEEIDDREIGGRFAVRHRTGLEGEPPLGTV
jgi:hypothetical protein